MQKVLLPLVLVALLAGCGSVGIPISETRINADLFDGKPDVMVERVGKLKDGMTKNEVFHVLGLTQKTPNLKRLSEEEIRTRLYGEVQPEQFEDAESFHRLTGKLDGFELPFVAKKGSMTLKLPFHTLRLDKGHELTVSMIFEEMGLYDQRIIGVAIINKTEKKIIYNPLETVKKFVQ